jgi:hypothetical protein
MGVFFASSGMLGQFFNLSKLLLLHLSNRNGNSTSRVCWENSVRCTYHNYLHGCNYLYILIITNLPLKNIGLFFPTSGYVRDCVLLFTQTSLDCSSILCFRPLLGWQVYATIHRFFTLRWGLNLFFLPGLALNHDPPNFSLPSNRNDTYLPLYSAIGWNGVSC